MKFRQLPGGTRGPGDDEPTVTEVAPEGAPASVRMRRRLALAALFAGALLLGVLSVVAVRAFTSPRGNPSAVAKVSKPTKPVRKNRPARSAGWLGICDHYIRGRLDLAVAASEREQPAPVSPQDRLWMIKETCEPYRQVLDTCREIDRGGVDSVIPATLEPDVRAAYARELKALCVEYGR